VNRPATKDARVGKVRRGALEETDDVVAVEEPLEIRIVERVGGSEREHSLAVTMRTPGHDFDLATGFLFAEGILRNAEDVEVVEHALPRAAEETGNVVRVVLREGLSLDVSSTIRSFYTTSSCGVCGKTSLDAIWTRKPPSMARDAPRLPRAVLAAMPEALRREQAVFARTGGLHAAGLFRADGGIVVLREDVGRHNAVDKVIGDRFRARGLPLEDHVLLVSGRASFEILQKAVMAGVPCVASVGAPSSLAVEVAREFGVTLVGFLRRDSFNVYAGATRIVD